MFYFIEPYEYARLEKTRNDMLKMKTKEKESLKQTAGSTQWAFYLKQK